MGHFVLIISLDLTKSSEVRKAGDWFNSRRHRIFSNLVFHYNSNSAFMTIFFFLDGAIILMPRGSDSSKIFCPQPKPHNPASRFWESLPMKSVNMYPLWNNICTTTWNIWTAMDLLKFQPLQRPIANLEAIEQVPDRQRPLRKTKNNNKIHNLPKGIKDIKHALKNMIS